jgi:hypothetical protein
MSKKAASAKKHRSMKIHTAWDPLEIQSKFSNSVRSTPHVPRFYHMASTYLPFKICSTQFSFLPLTLSFPGIFTLKFSRFPNTLVSDTEPWNQWLRRRPRSSSGSLETLGLSSVVWVSGRHLSATSSAKSPMTMPSPPSGRPFA